MICNFLYFRNTIYFVRYSIKNTIYFVRYSIKNIIYFVKYGISQILLFWKDGPKVPSYLLFFLTKRPDFINFKLNSKFKRKLKSVVLESVRETCVYNKKIIYFSKIYFRKNFLFSRIYFSKHFSDFQHTLLYIRIFNYYKHNYI